MHWLINNSHTHTLCQTRFVDFVTVQRDSDSWSFPINKWIKTKTGENGRAIIAINRCNTGEELEGLESAAMEAELGADAPTVPVPSGSDQAPAVTEEEDDWMMAPSATSTGPASFADDADAMPPIEDDEFDLPGADVLPLPEAAAAEVAAAVDATKTVPCTEEVAPVTTTPCPESSPTKTPCPEDTPMPSPCTEHPEMTETAEAPVVEVTTTPCPESTPTPIPAPIVGYGPVTPPLLPEEEEYPEVPESAVGPPPYVMPPPAPKGYGYGPVETPFPETEIIEEEYPAVPPPPSQGYSYGPVETPYPEILPPMEEEYEYGPVETPTPVVPKGYGYGPVETPFPETEEEEEEYPETPYAPPPPHHEYGYGPVETPFPPTPTGYGYGPVGTPFPEEDEYITETPLPQVVPLPPKGYGYGPVETPFPEQDLLIPTPTPSIPKKKKKCVHKKKHTGYAGGALPPVGTPLPGAIEDDFMGQLPKGLTDDEDNMSDMPEDMMDMAMGEDMMDDMTVSPQEKKASKEYELPYAKSH